MKGGTVVVFAVAGFALFLAVVFLAGLVINERDSSAASRAAAGSGELGDTSEPLKPVAGVCCCSTVAVLLFLVAVALWPLSGPSIHITR